MALGCHPGISADTVQGEQHCGGALAAAERISSTSQPHLEPAQHSAARGGTAQHSTPGTTQ